MAIDSTTVIGTKTTVGPRARIVPKRLASATLGPISGAPTLAVGQALAFSIASGVNKWILPDDQTTGHAADETDTIKGFVYPNPIKTSATNDVIGEIMLEGEIHADDIIAATNMVIANIKVDLQKNGRNRGIFVTGLADIR